MVIFTEHRDTLNYLEERIGALISQVEAVVVIHGSMGRDERRKAQERFTQDPEVQVLIATDAAGEGINLQRAHLMANYDLPWNPNRLEQRFGRIHQIGQTEVCHLWNLVAAEKREGEVYLRLLKKLDEERKALQGRVFDVLGKLKFADRSLRDLLIEAVRYGDHACTDRSSNRRVVSRQLQFVEIDADGQARTAGYAPYLDYRPLHEEERELLLGNRKEKIGNSDRELPSISSFLCGSKALVLLSRRCLPARQSALSWRQWRR